MSQTHKIVCCRCEHYHIVSEQVSSRIADAGIECLSVPDLCQLAADKAPILKEWSQTDNLSIVACHPRAIKWLFQTADAPLDESKVTYYNARTGDTDKIIDSLTGLKTSGQVTNIGDKTEWVPWFPVIDYDRCTNCKQCFNFCLFGVYALDDDKVKVQKPNACKTNCPACARVCPQKAIIFPKYKDSPINGDEVDESAIDHKTDISQVEELLGGNIHEIIRNRKAKKLFARPEDGTEKLSAQQKLSRLAALQKQLDIPQEVIDSLSNNRMSTPNTATQSNDCPNSEFCSRDCQETEGKQS